MPFLSYCGLSTSHRIIDEDLVALSCGGAGSTNAASYEYGTQRRRRLFMHGTLPMSDLADIYLVAVNAL